MSYSLSSLFKTNNPAEQEISKTQTAERKQEGETYQQWGRRWASITVADHYALTPALNVVILQQKTEQQRDREKQERNRESIRSEISGLEGNKNITQNKIDSLNDKKKAIEEQISTLKDELIEVRGSNKRNNIAQINFALGLGITLLLAVYLFVFYSSASFAAFFSNENLEDLGQAIFYPHAYGDAWNTGFGQFLFILLMPMIFLALGYLVHQFNVNRTGFGGYVKVATLYAVTFIFDALLAYEISEKIYNQIAMNTLTPMPPYSWAIAFESPAFWIIIFAGFIAYVIWGLVFDFTMESYAEMTSNATSIKKLQQKIETLESKIPPLNENITALNNELSAIEAKIGELKHKLDTGYLINNSQIKQELYNFFNGWCAYMAFAGKPEEDRVRAQGIFENINKTLDAD